MKKKVSVILLLLFLFSLCACSSHLEISDQKGDSQMPADEAAPVVVQPEKQWRCVQISYGDSYIVQYHYNDAGQVSEIVEYQNGGDAIDTVQSVTCNTISFDAQGNISSVTTNVDGMATEIVGPKTWRLSSESYILTVTYNDDFLCEQQIMDLVGNVTVTTTTTYDENGKAISAVNEFVYHMDGEDQTSSSTTIYDYDYDSNGNYLIRYAITETDKLIDATYSWE